MKRKKTLLIIFLVFVLILGGAAVLYRQLGDRVASDQLAVQEPQQTEESRWEETHQTGEVNTDSEQPVDESQESEVPQKLKAPDFTVYDALGNEVHLIDFMGKPIVLNFWASWCGPCKMEMPEFHEKYLELGGDIQFLMINMTDGSRETVKSASDFIAESGYTFPVFFDTQFDAASTYGAYSLPTTFFIDADGHAIAKATGAIDAETLQRGIDMIS